jgi:sugar lactone lactonase YvrE
LPPTKGNLGGITAGPDGNLWFTEQVGYGTDKIGRITPSGKVTEYPIPTANSAPKGITAGPDGNLWFTEYYANQIGRITPSGKVTEYLIPTAKSMPLAISAGADGNVWFTETMGGKIGRITPSGTITEFPLTNGGAYPYGITAAPDGNMWFTEGLGIRIARITPSGAITEYPLTTKAPFALTLGPDGNLWFNEISGDRIGRVSLTAPAITSPAAASFVSTRASSVTIQSTASPTASISLGGAALPAGVTFTDNGDGTATLSGTPAAGTAGSYALTVTASNGFSPAATQSLQLTVTQTPAITSAATVAFTATQTASFTITTTGSPAPAITDSGATLPAGVRFTDHGNGTATLSGIPAAGTGGSYPITVTADNGVALAATQNLTLTVIGPPLDVTPPAIVGKPTARTTLTCSPGTWTNNPSSYTYQWSRDGTPIVGATGATHVVQPIDEGNTLTCTATATNGAGASAAGANSGAFQVPVPYVPRCPGASGQLVGTSVGPAMLGLTRAQEHRAFRHSSSRGKRYEDFFCLTPIGVRVGYASPRIIGKHPTDARADLAGHVIWISTSSAYYSVAGIRPGATVTAAAAKLKLGPVFVIGVNDWYFAPVGPATAILKARHGVVEEIGIAENQLTSGRRSQRTFLTSFS